MVVPRVDTLTEGKPKNCNKCAREKMPRWPDEIEAPQKKDKFVSSLFSAIWPFAYLRLKFFSSPELFVVFVVQHETFVSPSTTTNKKLDRNGMRDIARRNFASQLVRLQSVTEPSMLV